MKGDSQFSIEQQVEALDSLIGETDEAQLPNMDELFEGIQQKVDAQGPRSWFQSKSTPVRRGFAIASFLLLALLTFFLIPRPDMGQLPLWYLGTVGVSLVFLGCLSLWVAFRPAYVPSLSRSFTWALLSAGLISTAIIGLLPMPHVDVMTLPEGVPWLMQSKCMKFGLLMGLPVYIIARLIDRDSPLSPLLLGSAAGLCGNLALQFHCPVHGAKHVLLTHVPAWIIFVIASAGLVYFEARRKQRAS